MDAKFLPEQIRQQLDGDPDYALRGSGGFNGKTGESYLIFQSPRLLLFERNFGDNNFAQSMMDCVADDSMIELVQDRFSSELKIGNQYSIKLSGLETNTAALMISQIESLKKQLLLNDSEIHKPLMLLIMILEDLKHCNDPDSSENHILQDYIVSGICGGNRPLYLAGLELYRQGALTAYLDNTALDIQQKRCILANMLELVMRDGEFSKEEQKIIINYGRKLGIEQQDFDAVWNVILDKNCLALLL